MPGIGYFAMVDGKVVLGAVDDTVLRNIAYVSRTVPREILNKLAYSADDLYTLGIDIAFRDKEKIIPDDQRTHFRDHWFYDVYKINKYWPDCWPLENCLRQDLFRAFYLCIYDEKGDLRDRLLSLEIGKVQQVGSKDGTDKTDPPREVRLLSAVTGGYVTLTLKVPLFTGRPPPKEDAA